MEAYINSLSCISHHPTFEPDFFFEGSGASPVSPFLQVAAPVYKDFIPAATIRRTSHILKMGISGGLMCLGNEGSEQTDAIVVGTAMGCYEDTDKFLRSIDENGERMLTPTSFIQSTHNTVAGQIALLVKCHGYNFTYVHQNLSFEYALLDAMLLLKEGEAQKVLLGGLDELNPALCELFERAGHIKKQEDLKEPIWKTTGNGYVAGEGACFFSLGAQKTEKSVAKIKGLKIIQEMKSDADLNRAYENFLKELELKKEDLSLVLSGINGNGETDRRLNAFTSNSSLPVAYFKQLCGEYFTASGFAVWLSALILKKQEVPARILPDGTAPKSLKNILIINQQQDKHYSMICVSAC